MKSYSSLKILVVGAILWVVGFISILLLPEEFQLIHFFHSHDVLVTHSIQFLALVFLAPVLEEMVFRFGLTFSKTYVFYIIIAVITITLLTWQSFIIVMLLASILHFSRVNTQIKMILIGSLAFSFCHLINFYQLTIAIFPYFLIIFGLSLVLSYIRIKNGILMAIATHSIYNFFLLYAYYQSNPENISYTDQNIILEMNRTDLLSSDFPNITFGQDTLIFKSKSIESLIRHMSKTNTNEFHYYPKSVKYQGKAIFKNKESNLFHCHYFGYDTINICKIGSGYSIQIGDRKTVDENEQVELNDFIIFNTIKGILVHLSDTYKIPIEFINEKEMLTYSKKYKVSYRLKNSFEENIEIISNQIGYNLIISEKEIPYKNVEYKKIN